MTGSPRPLVSIVTPALNAARYIDYALRSVRDQEYEPLEHIVADGGSSDGTLEIVSRYPHVALVSERDSGQADALAKGFARARGEILAWLNADDVYYPGAVAQAVELLRRGAYGLVYSAYDWIDERGEVVRECPVQPFDLDWMLNTRNQIPQPTAFFTRAAYEAVGGIDRSLHYAMDYDLWLKIGRRFPVGYSSETWAAFRMHPESKTVAVQERFWPEERRVSRANGGQFFSRQYLDRLAARHPLRAYLLQRAAAAWRMLRRGDLRRFGQRLATVYRFPR